MAIAHIGLMLIISIMVQIFNSVTWIIPIILIGGNAFVIILEAFLSGIQNLRLQLYEFLENFTLEMGFNINLQKYRKNFRKLPSLKKQALNQIFFKSRFLLWK